LYYGRCNAHFHRRRPRHSAAFKAELEVEGSQIDDGFMTAAHITGVFIVKRHQHPEFHEQVWAFANEIANNPGCSIGNRTSVDNDAPPMGSRSQRKDTSPEMLDQQTNIDRNPGGRRSPSTGIYSQQRIAFHSREALFQPGDLGLTQTDYPTINAIEKAAIRRRSTPSVARSGTCSVTCSTSPASASTSTTARRASGPTTRTRRAACGLRSIPDTHGRNVGEALALMDSENGEALDAYRSGGLEQMDDKLTAPLGPVHGDQRHDDPRHGLPRRDDGRSRLDHRREGDLQQGPARPHARSPLLTPFYLAGDVSLS
jgi:hypothetical protein